MPYAERAILFGRIEALRNRPLICYVTSHRQNAMGGMSSDAVIEFTKQLDEIPKDKKEIDILIVSNGGDPTVSWRIMSMLRARFTKISVLLPFGAYSAATLLALGADEIVMHPYSNLGPVDPQLQYRRKVPNPGGPAQGDEVINFGSEDLRNFLDFVKSDVGISDQEQLQRSFELVSKEIGAIPIGIAKRSSHLSLSMGEKLLSLHMQDQNKAKAIAEVLNKSFYHHGYPLGRKEAKEIGLPVEEPKADLEKLIWDVWLDFEKEMQCSEPFNPLEVVMNDATVAAQIGPVRQVQLPANLPPNLLQPILNQILQQIGPISVNPVDYELFQATLESTKCRSQFKTKGKINAVRMPDLNIIVNVLSLKQGWAFTKT